MPKIDDNYDTLLVAADPNEEPWSSRELRVLAVGMSKWEWPDPVRKDRLPSLIAFTPSEAVADVIVRWEDDMGFTDAEVDDETAGAVTRSVPVLGSVDTDLSGQEKVIMRLSRKLFTEVDPTNWSRAAQHELGHCLGLSHSDGGIMKGINLSPSIITQKNREDAAVLRKQGVVGVDSLEGD